MRVVVIGGGIVGLSSAYSLAECGAEVIVCERSSLGDGSTARSVGGIRTQFSTPVNVDLSLASLDTWERFEERFGVDIAFRQHGYLFVAREAETETAFRRSVAMQRDRGAPVEFLEPAEAADYCPGLRTDSFRAATYAGSDGYADPYLAVQGYADAARELGVDIRTKTAVTDVRTASDGSVSGVRTDSETIETDFVVNAAGPWARQLAEMAGLQLPVAPRRRQVLVADPETAVPESLPLVIDLDTGSYFRPEREGAALVGGEFGGPDPDVDPDGFDESIDLEWAATAIERAADAATYFGEETRIRRGWAGLYAVTPDHHPILEESVPGFINAIGYSGHGFQHAPATGRIVAELAFDGDASLVDVDRLRSDRFDDGELLTERNVA